jgi:hypothetical protein
MNTLILIHVAISLVAILSGLIVLIGLLASGKLNPLNGLFIWTTLATTVTGFFFPFKGFTPAIGVGIVSLIVLAPAFYALYVKRLSGAWGRVYVVPAMIALYLNVFVLIVQSFQQIAPLKALAPTQTEAPFVAAQLITLVAFVVLTIVATRKFRV